MDKETLMKQPVDIKYGLSVLYKYTNQCNLHCSYCYADAAKNNLGSISMDQLRSIYQWLADYCAMTGRKEFKWTFHGGEPLLCGLDTLKAALALQEEIFTPRGIKVGNAIQTNLTLITNEYVPVLKAHFDSSIGVSLDYGTGARLYADGRDSFDDVAAKVRMLKEEGISCSIISLLNRRNVNKISEIYHFFKELGTDFSLCRVFPAELKDNSGGADALSDKEYADAIIELFDIWTADPEPAIRVKNLEEFSVSLLTGIPVLCCNVKNCLDCYLCIGPNGDILPCTRFNDAKFLLGNVFNEGPADFLAHRRSDPIGKNYPPPARCSQCDYERICYGGCLHERTLTGESFMCNSMKRIFKHIESYLTSQGLPLYESEVESVDVTMAEFV
ncbi:MAG: radical SAM protein [Treponema sp.]|jgi:uncharacterized protein|nr:radical SAM protein [Treponema sp.]